MKKTLLLSIVSAGLLLADSHEHTEEKPHYIPDISVIMDASYVNRSMSDEKVAHLEIPGVVHGLLGVDAHAEHAHAPYNANNGFNLNYAELILSNEVDNYLNMKAVLHFSEASVAVDELYFTTKKLPYDLKVKGGKFLSAFGYLNEHHHHAWNFADMPLVYESFLGMHGINEKGVQVQYPIALGEENILLGVEILQGENENMFGYTPITLPTATGATTYKTIESSDVPALYVAYLKGSFELQNSDIHAGLSYARGSSKLDHSMEEEPYAFSGMSSLYGADFVLKYHIGHERSLTWQSEWLMRIMDGTTYEYESDILRSRATRKKQAGLYSQLIYGVNDHWSFGVRYDTIYQNSVKKSTVELNLPENLEKYTVMAKYKTSDISFFRLQYSKNNALYNEDGQRQDIDTIILQVNISIGTHSDHDGHSTHKEHHQD